MVKVTKKHTKSPRRSVSDDEDFTEYEVEYILLSMSLNRRTYLLVKWLNYPFNQSTFVVKKDVHSPILYEQFQEALSFDWENAELVTIIGYFKSADELFVVGVFAGAPQPILLAAEDAQEKFELAREYVKLYHQRFDEPTKLMSSLSVC